MDALSGFLSSLGTFKGVVATLMLLFAGVEGYMGFEHPADTPDSLTVNFDENKLQDMRQADAEQINNEIQNMLAGDVNSATVHKDIFDEKFFAKKVVDCTPEELKVNNRYIAYLSAADGVVTAYSNGSPDLNTKINEMNAKKELI